MTIDSPPLHGGDLLSASQKYKIELESWLDLSTGISPFSYPIPSLSDDVWKQLPYTSVDCIESAHTYYKLNEKTAHSHSLVLTAGSQFSIGLLPRTLAKLPVVLPSVGYQEHRFAWQKHGNKVSDYNSISASSAYQDITLSLRQNPKQHLVVIQPNNPTGLLFSRFQLLELSKKIAAPGMLIIDEAFIDLSPECSLLKGDVPDNTIILRSFGKFFGLAGIRVGAAIAPVKLAEQLKTEQGPWPISGASLQIAQSAWSNTPWQDKQRHRIHAAYQATKQRFAFLDDQALPVSTQVTSLFISYCLPIDFAQSLFEFFAQSGILLRYLKVNDKSAIIRIGLIDHRDPEASDKLDQALERFLANYSEYHTEYNQRCNPSSS